MPTALAGSREIRCAFVAPIEEAKTEALTLRAPARSATLRVACEQTRDPLAETPGIETMLLRSYRDVRDSGLTVDEFRRCAAARVELSDHTWTLTVEAIWSEYDRAIKRNHATDESGLFTRATDAVRDGASVPAQSVFGFYDATGAQYRRELW